MAIIGLVGFSLAAGVVLVLLRQQRPELAIQLAMAVGAVLFFLIIGRIMTVVDMLESLITRARVDGLYLNTVLRIIGIAYVAEFGAQMLRDAGEGAVAGKVEMAGKVLILVLAVPIILAVLDTILSMLA